MPIIQCTSCGQRLDVETELVSIQIECPTCTSVVSIPAKHSHTSPVAPGVTVTHAPTPPVLPLQHHAASPPAVPTSASKKPALLRWILAGGGVLAVITLVAFGVYALGYASRYVNKPLSDEMAIKEELEQAQQLYLDTLDRIDAGEKPAFRFPLMTELNSSEDLYRKWLYDYFNDMIEYHQEYSAEMKMADAYNLLNSERLAADEGFVDTYRNLGRIKMASTRLHEKMLKRNTLFRTGKMDVDAPIEWQEELQSLNATSSGEAMKRRSAEWEFESKLLTHMSAVISLLDHQRDQWHVENGAIIFHNERDLMEYKKLMTEMATTLQASQELKGRR